MLCVLSALVLLGRVGPIPERSLDWAESALREESRYTGLKAEHVARLFPRTRPEQDSIVRFATVIKRYGPCAEGYYGLARAYLLYGRYEEALGTARQWLSLAPADLQANSVNARAEAFVRAASALKAALGYPDRCIVLPFKDDRWVGVVARFDESTLFDDGDPDSPYIAARCVLFRFSGERASVLSSLPCALLPGDETSEHLLTVADVAADGKPKVCWDARFWGASHMPEVLQVLSVDGDKLRVVGHAPYNEGMTMTDLNGDRKVEIVGTISIGAELAHVEMPRWSDVLEWNGKAYVDATGKFMRVNRFAVKEIRRLLKEHEDDWELLLWNAFALEYAGRHKAAVRSLHRCAVSLHVKLSGNNAADRLVRKLPFGEPNSWYDPMRFAAPRVRAILAPGKHHPSGRR